MPNLAFRHTFSLLLVLNITGISFSEDWTNWRGPQGNGTVTAGDYPVEWSETIHLSWKIDLPSRAGSTPVVIGNKVILTATIDNQNGVLCFDENGKELWRKAIGDVRVGKHKKASGSNPSPVTDGKHVFVYW